MEQFQHLVIFIFAFSMLAGTAFTFATLIGSSVYDLRRLRLQYHGKRGIRKRPLVSIIIAAHNEEQLIARCIESVLASSYPRIEVVVVDDASTDSTRKIVRRFIRSSPKVKLELFAKRRQGGKGAAINEAIIRFARGKLIMTIDADCVVAPDAIANAVKHFDNSETVGMAANVRITPQQSLFGMMQQFEYLIGFRAKKFYTVANCEYIIGGAGAMYRREVFNKLGGFSSTMQTEDIALSLAIAQMGNRKNKMVYGSDVLIYTEPAPTYKSLLRQRYRWKFGSLQAIFAQRSLVFSRSRNHTLSLSWVRLPMALWSEILLVLEPLFFSYFVFLALAYRNPILFTTAWAAMSGLLLLAVWGDEHLSIKTRARLSLLVPLMYIVFFVMTTVQIIAAFRCVINIRAIMGKKYVPGAWTSPERIG